jgi:Protein of unknown function (DUF3999)
MTRRLPTSHTLVGLLFLFRSSSLVADFKMSDWEFYKAIQADSTTTGHVRCSLDGEVYDRSRSSLSDLRIVDDRHREVPYALFEAKETTTEKPRYARIFNRAMLPKAYSTTTLDLGEGAYSNKLVIKTKSENFKRRVEIAGSPDGKKWFILRNNGYIFDFSGDQKVQLTSVQYPENNYRYLEVKVWNGSEPVLKLDGVDVFLTKTETPQRILVPSHPVSREEDPKLKASLCIFDLGSRNIPCDLLVLETPEENFSRLVEIQGSNDRKNWQRHLQSEFYRFKTSKYDVEKKTFRFPEARSRYLKVIVYNYDDLPLQLSKFEAQGIPKDVIFQAEANRHYFLYYGNEWAPAPRYDLGRVKNYLNLETLARVKLSSESINHEFVSSASRRPWTERWPVFFWSVLVFLILVLGAYIIQLMRKVKAV